MSLSFSATSHCLRVASPPINLAPRTLPKRFVPSSTSGIARTSARTRALLDSRSSEEDSGVQLSRRTALQLLPLAVVSTGGAVTLPHVSDALAAVAPVPEGTKVVVLGGTGFVGSRVVEALVARGAEVVSVSRRGEPGALSSKLWADKVTWTKGDALTDDLMEAFKGSTAVISCIGVIGGSDEAMQKGNGAANEAATVQAAAAGVPKFVYISVASIVESNVEGIALKGYFEGKRQAEAAVTANFPDSSVIIKPSFIYGGDEFTLTPPRVPKGYGGFIEGLLSSGPVRGIAGVSPGLVALTLAPPVAVENVAGAAVAAALGGIPSGSKVDGTAAINSFSKL